MSDGGTPFAHPDDYARSPRGVVSVAEFNRWLPWFRCRDCGMWLLGDQLHTVEICNRAKERHDA